MESGPSRVKDPDEVTDNSCTKLSSSLIPNLDIVPICILPLAVAEEVIDVIELNLVDPIAVLDDATPVMFSDTTAPSSFVPVTVKTLPVSDAEQ